MEYKLESDEKSYKSQYRAFREDTGFQGVFKKNLHSKAEPHKVVGEEILGVTKSGQLVKITFDGEMLKIEW